MFLYYEFSEEEESSNPKKQIPKAKIQSLNL